MQLPPKHPIKPCSYPTFSSNVTLPFGTEKSFWKNRSFWRARNRLSSTGVGFFNSTPRTVRLLNRSETAWIGKAFWKLWMRFLHLERGKSVRKVTGKVLRPSQNEIKRQSRCRILKKSLIFEAFSWTGKGKCMSCTVCIAHYVPGACQVKSRTCM